MQRRDRRTNPRQTANHQNPSLWVAIKASSYPLSHSANRPGSATADGVLEFGRVRVLLRQRQLLADGVRRELGTRAFDLLLVLLEADGSLVTKEELLDRVWPGIVVSEGNLKVQISALRRALGADRSAIRTEFVTTHPWSRRDEDGRPVEASWRDEDGAASEGVAEGLESGTAVEPPCGDDG